MRNPRPASDRISTSPVCRRTPRGRTVAAAHLTALALAGLLLTACAPRSDGSAPSPGASDPGTATPEPGTASPDPGTAPAGRALLDVSVRADESAAQEQYVLECADGRPGPATTHPDAEAACADVLSLGADFFTAERDPDLACTQQYGGPQTARVTGTVDGEPVDTGFSRTDGCEIARWDAAQSLLGPGGVDLPPESSGPGAARP
ncbi:SSI family serine proteinase inhibitor [Kocuria sp. M1R5S2]|uniref:SSI family serine proteinase inhibitor n=1 Tax=Kocuria rhizosphaerae TaxID=3376285 RepID=UPI0037AEB6E5